MSKYDQLQAIQFLDVQINNTKNNLLKQGRVTELTYYLIGLKHGMVRTTANHVDFLNKINDLLRLL
jgi:hypothetical protein